ncbi:MAG: 1-acyl-sn-glycerol-3-phosphate acyltransferase [Bacteroidales bacterium]|nr:1-acyl-sn-glycerol-3-phosphate acyltransferase [Bacteroidales bacterium]
MKELILKEGVYQPSVGIDYPTDDPLTKLLPFKNVKNYVFDENFPYFDKSLKFRLNHAVAHFIVHCPLYIVNKLKYGMRYRGRDVLRGYKSQFKNGIITVCNHCYRLDGAAIAQLLHHDLWTPMLKEHINGEDSWSLRHFGGIPVPDTRAAMAKFNEAFDEIHERKGWINVFAEGRRWSFYKPLKPFMKGAFTMAYKYNVPIVPVCITFRERKGIYKYLGPKNEPLMTITAGHPIFPDRNNRRNLEVDRLLHLTHATICEMAGIEQNPWPAFWPNEAEVQRG